MPTFNPFDTLDVILADWASERVRRLIHGVILLAAFVVTVWLAAEGDWLEAVLALAGALYAGANKANTPAVEDDEDHESAEEASARLFGADEHDLGYDEDDEDAEYEHDPSVSGN